MRFVDIKQLPKEKDAVTCKEEPIKYVGAGGLDDLADNVLHQISLELAWI